MPTYQAPADAPQWFVDNLQQAGESRYITVNGKALHFLSWNWQASQLPLLVLVHGFGGHAHWWSFLAPFFSSEYRVAALDLPGFGDSEFLDQYTDSCFAEAILALIHHHQSAPAIVIGHSFGGAQTLNAMAMDTQAIQRGIVVDSNIPLPPDEPIRRLEPHRSHKRRASLAECMARFRLVPPQPGAIDALLQYVAYHSCTHDADGWFWKFDPAIRNAGEIDDLSRLARISQRVDCIYGEHSWFNNNDRPQRVLALLPAGGEAVIIPGAHHHILLDQPLALVETIRRLLAEQA